MAIATIPLASMTTAIRPMKFFTVVIITMTGNIMAATTAAIELKKSHLISDVKAIEPTLKDTKFRGTVKF